MALNSSQKQLNSLSSAISGPINASLIEEHWLQRLEIYSLFGWTMFNQYRSCLLPHPDSYYNSRLVLEFTFHRMIGKVLRWDKAICVKKDALLNEVAWNTGQQLISWRRLLFNHLHSTNERGREKKVINQGVSTSTSRSPTSRWREETTVKDLLRRNNLYKMISIFDVVFPSYHTMGNFSDSSGEEERINPHVFSLD